MQLAELNIGRLGYSIGDPRIADFINNLNRISALAQRTDGFIWRLTDDGGNGSSHAKAFDDPALIVNMSVWRDVKSLENFVWNTVHRQFYARRAQWFSVMEMQHFVMWFVEDGHRPDLGEAKERLDYFNRHGNSDHAFDWSHLSEATLWQQARCA